MSSVAIAVVSLLTLVASLAAAQPTVPVSGRVVASETGQPVAEARIILDGTAFAATSDAAGAFTLVGVPPGTYTLVAGREGFETVRSSVAVAADGAPIEVRLPFDLALKEEITVVGRTVGDLGPAGTTTTASRLGLKPMEIPASVDVLDSTVMEARGYLKVSDAVSSMAGVVSGENPTAPSSFVIRGFTASQVSNLRDGLWLGPSTMVMRPQNTFNLDRVELLRGPSSVINGQGAVAGTINAVNPPQQQSGRAWCRLEPSIPTRRPRVRPAQWAAPSGIASTPAAAAPTGMCRAWMPARATSRAVSCGDR